MATTTTKTTKKKKLVYKQDPDGVFRLKKINDDTSSLKTNEVIDKKTQVDNYLNELIDCSYSIIDDDEQSNTAHTATPEENFNKITTPTTATTVGVTTRRKKIKPTTINTSSKNLKLKSTSPVPVPATTTTPIQPQRIVVTAKSDQSPPPTQPISSPPSPTLVSSPTEFTVKTIKEEPEAEEQEEEEIEEEMVHRKPTLLSKLLSHVPGFVVGVISTCLGLRYKQELAYGILGLTVIGTALGVVTLLGIGSCLYLGLIKLEDLKKYTPFYSKPKVVKESIVIKEGSSEPPTPQHEDDGEEANEKYEGFSHEVEDDVYLPEYHHEEPVMDIDHREYQPMEMYEEEPIEQFEPQYPHKHQELPHPEEYQPLEGPRPPKQPKQPIPKRTPSTVKVKPYRCEKRDQKVFNVVPINNSIPLPNTEPRYHIKTKPELIRASTEPSRLNSRKKKSGSSSPTSAKSENYYSNIPHHQHQHHTHHTPPTGHSQPAQVGVPPQLFKVKQLPNLPPQAEELPFINEVRLVDGFNDTDDADEIITPSEAPAYHYKTGHPENPEYLRRNQSIMSKQSVLGTRSNYKKFISNVHDDY